MKSINVYMLLTITFLATLSNFSSGFKVPQNAPSDVDHISKEDNNGQDLIRLKRQLENLDEDFPTTQPQDSTEETGFWDRVVKVALKLFNRFIEWLNS